MVPPFGDMNDGERIFFYSGILLKREKVIPPKSTGMNHAATNAGRIPVYPIERKAVCPIQ